MNVHMSVHDHRRLSGFGAAVLALVVLPAAPSLLAQAPGVPVYAEGPGTRPMAALRTAAKKLKASGELLSQGAMAKQLDRKGCSLELPPASARKLDARELWQRARKAHIRVGWYYLCNDCKRWHVDLSGGYAITKDAVATCAHVIGDGKDATMKEGYLIAADDDDHLYAVKEVLAVNAATDTAILRLATDQLQSLPLGSDVVPGDPVVCFSDPMDRRGVFSTGIVSRFMRRPFLREEELTPDQRKHPATVESPVWVQVSADWAPGSSGSAVLDACGNAIGHVSEIEPILDEGDDVPLSVDEDGEEPEQAVKPEKTDADATAPPLQQGTVIVFHDAIAASNVRALVRR